MQVFPNSAAANIASVVAQSTSKDRSSANPTAPNGPGVQNMQAQVEQSGTANADRDAQGQGDGMGPRNRRNPEAEANTSDSTATGNFADNPADDDDLNHLDIVG